jgi:hypothetical protein
VDFCITDDIPQDFALAKLCFDPSSYHSPVLITLTAHALNQEKQPSLSNIHTNWDDFRNLINGILILIVSLKTKAHIEAVVIFFKDTIQWAGWNAMLEHTDTLKTYNWAIYMYIEMNVCVCVCMYIFTDQGILLSSLHPCHDSFLFHCRWSHNPCILFTLSSM